MRKLEPHSESEDDGEVTPGAQESVGAADWVVPRGGPLARGRLPKDFGLREKPRPARPSRAGRIVLVVILSWGLYAGYVTGIAPLRERLRLRGELARTGRLYRDFQRRFVRSPTDLAELRLYHELLKSPEAEGPLLTPAGFKSDYLLWELTGPIDLAVAGIESGRIEFVWNADPVQNFAPRGCYLAIERRSGPAGGFVLQADGTVDLFEGPQFKILSPASALSAPPPERRLRRLTPETKRSN